MGWADFRSLQSWCDRFYSRRRGETAKPAPIPVAEDPELEQARYSSIGTATRHRLIEAAGELSLWPYQHPGRIVERVTATSEGYAIVWKQRPGFEWAEPGKDGYVINGVESYAGPMPQQLK